MVVTWRARKTWEYGGNVGHQCDHGDPRVRGDLSNNVGLAVPGPFSGPICKPGPEPS